MEVLDRIDDSRIDELTRRDEFFWLDVETPSPEEVHDLAERFGWHRLLVEDVVNFNQRPKLDSYDDHSLVVFFGARVHDDDFALTEVHVIVSGSYIVTVRHEPCDELARLREHLTERPPGSEEFVVYKILDALTDSFFPLIEHMDEELDELEDAVADRAGVEERQRITRLRHNIVLFRQKVAPQRDLAARTLDDLKDIPGLSEDAHDYWRDLYDHLIRIAEQLDSYRDLLSGVMDIYLSTVSNRLNGQMKTLTIIATIFLPLTFVTGFFGQNFGWLVRHITSLEVFLLYGIGGLIVPIAALFLYFRRQRYL